MFGVGQKLKGSRAKTPQLSQRTRLTCTVKTVF